MLRVWNVTLVIVTFFLTIFGTFMTRSGVVQSVHAFGDDPVLARLFIGFMVVILTFSFGLVIYRLPLLRARNELDSWVSREAAFLVNNWILLFSALFVLFATMFPTLSEAVTGNRLTVGRAVLQQVDGADRPHPAVPHRRRPAARVAQVDARQPARRSSCGRRRRGSSPRGALAALGVRIWPSGLCFALCAFVAGTIVQEFWRGAQRAQQQHRHRFLHRARRPGRPQQAPLRRLHRPRRHRADLPRLRRQRLQARRAGAAEARSADDDRQVHASATTASR